MNTVEAVEQLGKLGRKLQAREVGLQQPVTALRRAADWETLLGDPAAALSQVLGTAGAGLVRAKGGESTPEAPVSSLPLAPFRWEEDRPPAGNGLPAARSGSGSGENSAAASPSGPAGGIRLARRQTSLLGILNANLEDRVYAQAGDQGGAGALTGEARSGDRPAARGAPPAPQREPLAPWRGVPAEPRGGSVSTPSVAQDEVREPSEQAPRLARGLHQGEVEAWDDALLTGQGMVSERSTAASAADRSLAGDSEVGAGMGVWGYESPPQQGPESTVRAAGRREPVYGTVDGFHTGIPAGRDEEAVPPSVGIHDQMRAERRAGGWGGRPQYADVAAGEQDGVWAMADAVQGNVHGERPLSMAQIEQVLAALDERLELGLLRLYGAAGGLP